MGLFHFCVRGMIIEVTAKSPFALTLTEENLWAVGEGSFDGNVDRAYILRQKSQKPKRSRKEKRRLAQTVAQGSEGEKTSALA